MHKPYYRDMRNPLAPEHMSDSERLAELGRILAAGLIRMRARKSSALSADRGESSVDFRPRRAVMQPATQEA